jgi:hypothetical protein
MLLPYGNVVEPAAAKHFVVLIQGAVVGAPK